MIAHIPDFSRSYIVCLEDNQVVVGSFARGRSSKPSVNRLCRRKAALELAADVALIVVWCGTDRMVMDRLSRHRVLERF